MTCKKGGQHRLPAGEQSWKDPQADQLVAAGLDGCQPCQGPLLAELSTTPLPNAFGALFTTWIFDALSVYVSLGEPVAETAGSLIPVVSNPSFTVLRAVKLPRRGGFVTVDASEALGVLEGMTDAERREVLNDVLDGIVGKIAMDRAGRLPL